MQCAFLPIFLLVVCVTGLAVGLLAAASFFNPGRRGRVTQMPYESGMDPIHDTRRRFDVRFHLLAIAFLVFDVELLFLYPWAVCTGGDRAGGRGIEAKNLAAVTACSTVGEANSLGAVVVSDSGNLSKSSAVVFSSRRLVFAGVMAFLGLLTLGFIYDWRKGVFRWR